MLLLAALAAAPVALAPCDRVHVSQAATPAPKPTIRRLDRMPPARQILGVMRTQGGCLAPIVVHDEVGDPTRR